MRVRGGLFLFLVLGLPAMLMAQQTNQPFRVALGIDYSSGDYGDSVDTDIVFIPLSLSLTDGPWTLRVIAPWVDVTGPADIFAPHNPGEEEEHAAEDERTSVSGLGDMQLGVSSIHQVGKSVFYVSPSAWVKVPTADDEKRLGTGEFDYWFRVTGMAPILGRGWLFASAGYRWMGSSSTIPLEDRALAGIGLQSRIGQWGLGSSYDFQQSSVHSADDLHEMTLFVNRRIAGAECTLYGRRGFTEASPDLGIGLRVGVAF